MDGLFIIANKYKLYDDLLIISIHSTNIQEEKIERLWHLFSSILFKYSDKIGILNYYKNFLLKMGRFQWKIPQNIQLRIDEIQQEVYGMMSN